jgi:hypothetical protein
VADLFCKDEFTPADKLKEIERELGFRRHVYARRVADKKMKQSDSDRQIGIMEAIATDYREIVAAAEGRTT